MSDFKQIDAQFGRLGQQWVTTAGASTGAWLGLCICVLITVGVLVYQKKKGSNDIKAIISIIPEHSKSISSVACVTPV